MARNDETLPAPVTASGQSQGISEKARKPDGHRHRHIGHLHGHHRPKAQLAGVLPNAVRNELVAFLAEFSGTFMFLLFAFIGTQVANEAAGNTGTSPDATHGLAQAPNVTTLLYIAMAFGVSLAVNVWIFYRISGGLFNPVVSLALYLVGAVKGIRAALCFLSHILGGICAAAVASAILPGALNVDTALGGNTNVARGLFIEMFATCELVLAILFLAAEKHKATFLAPIGIGLALFIAELCGVYYTGGSLNPARSFGPAVVTGSFTTYHWIYWLGPIMGSLLAVGFYKLMKLGDYETVNPGQDFNDEEAELFKPPEDAETAADVRRPNAGVAAQQISVQQATEQAAQEAVEKVVRDIAPSLVGSVSPEARREGTSLGTEEDTRYSQASTLETMGNRDLDGGSEHNRR